MLPELPSIVPVIFVQ